MVQGGCGFSILRYIQNLTGDGPEQPAAAYAAMNGELDSVISKGPCQLELFSASAIP